MHVHYLSRCNPHHVQQTRRACAQRWMKRIDLCLVLSLVALWPMAAPAAADSDFVAAGVLLVAEDDQSADDQSSMLFLVRHRSRSWYEIPGGRRQFVSDKDGETAYETAIRECFEETRGYLSPDILRKVVDPSRYLRDGGFVFFVGKIKQFPMSEIVDLSHLDDDLPPGFREVADYAWVNVQSVVTSTDGTVIDAHGRRITLRRQLKSRLERAQAAGWL